MAHAIVASLMRTIESLLISNSPVESLISYHIEKIHALHEKVSSLEVFLKNFEKNNVSRKMTDFEVEVKEVANSAEYTIQLGLTEIVTGQNKSQKKKARQRFHRSLHRVAEDIDHVCKESTKIQDKGKQVSKELLVKDFSSSTKDILNVKSNMVGRDDQRKQLLKDLTRDYSSEPKVIPIIGMGGIGKTTLAREVYNDECIHSHFDVCAWATVSQQHSVKEIWLSLLRSTKSDMFNMDDETELADMLRKSLKGKRYLIIMDDIWSSEVWDNVRLCFPGENNAGSRILLTTRNNEVACYAGTENRSLQMDFMDQDESWKLFKSAAFANEALPFEFESTGKQIAEKCHGLPLTIVVVAGLLKSKTTIKYWENVAKNVKSITNDPDKQCLDVLELSYNDLTSDMKACLLYFGIFPEDTEIPVTKLMRLWMAEGFLNLEKDLEREAEKCLQDLIDRCLVLVSEKSRDETKIRSCKVHDLIHDLCLREIQRGNVFLMNDIVFKESDAIKAKTHDLLFDCEPSESPSLSRHKMQPFKRWTGDEIYDFRHGLYRALLIPGHHQLTTTDGNNNIHLERARSIFFSGYVRSTFILKSELTHFKLLKVLDLNDIVIDSFPLQILSLIWLRYLSLFTDKNFVIPPEICMLWNLQTIIIGGYEKATFPEQIWGLTQLLHLEKYDLVLPDCPSISVDTREKNMGFSNIQTVSGLSLHCCTKDVILGIQNVKKLGINGSFQPSDGLFDNLVHLHQLESLSLNHFKLYSGIPGAKSFPATLKKLKLEGNFLCWWDLDVIAELPNLEVLMLKSSCFGDEWDLNLTVFTRLKLLLIKDSDDLHYWKATNDNFPVLERLVIRDCPYLDEIPIEFADIHSLQLIELEGCNPKLAVSAQLIQQEQEDLGNNPVVVIIKSPREKDDDAIADDDNEDSAADEDDDNEDC